jgi:hypothetical protein
MAKKKAAKKVAKKTTPATPADNSSENILKLDTGKTYRGRFKRQQEKLQEKSDAAIIAATNREKTPAEQEEFDANVAGTSVEGLRAVREGRASFINSKPKPEVALTPVDLSLPENVPALATPKDWSPSTRAGIFTPAPTGAIRGNRAQPMSTVDLQNMQSRLTPSEGETSMGIPGSEQSMETVTHPNLGQISVPTDLARAHRLYAADYENNPAQANRLAGLQGDEDFAAPVQHKSGHYERLGRLQAAGEDPREISIQARKMNKTVYDLVEEKHALLQDKKDSETPVNFGMQHLNEKDTFVHPETGKEHPITEWSSVHNMPTTPEGLPALVATKGTNLHVYEDTKGNKRTTIPTHIGWWKDPTDGQGGRENLGARPGRWRMNTAPQVLPGAEVKEGTMLPAYDYSRQELQKALPTGSKQSRQLISEAASAMAAIHATSSGSTPPGRISTNPVTNPVTGRAISEFAPVGHATISVAPAATSTKIKKGRKGSKTISSTAKQNLELSEQLRGQVEEPTTGKELIAKAAKTGFKPAAQPTFNVDESGNPVPQMPVVGVKGVKRQYVQTSGSPRGGVSSQLKSFTAVHGLASDEEGPAVTSGIPARPARRNKRTGGVITPEVKKVPGMVGFSTPLAGGMAGGTGTQPTLPGMEPSSLEQRKSAEAELKTTSSNSVPTMTEKQASKFGRIYLEDNPKSAPAQPMLDFGQPEREEEQSKLAAGKISHRNGEQWGFLDKRWLGGVKDQTNSEQLESDLTSDRNSKMSEKPRGVVASPAGLPKGRPTGLGDTDAGQQLKGMLAKMRGETTEE